MSVKVRCCCGAVVEVTAEPFDPAALYVCDDCEMGILTDQARAFGPEAEAFRCVRCQNGLIGWVGSPRLCDDCEDALHAEALEMVAAAGGSGRGR